MPYAAVERPSLAAGLLKASLMRGGISARVCYANLAFAETIGLPKYFFLSNNLPKYLMGEWTFAGAAFPDFQPDHTPYLNECAQLNVSPQLLQTIRDQATLFVERIAQQVLVAHPRIVGCTSMFQQHCASLAVLRRVKTLRPDVITLLGGANCEGTMGIATQQFCDWVDYVVSGEADQLLPDLCQDILRRGAAIPPTELPVGVYARAHRNGAARALVCDLDATPVPSYDDYFAALDASPLASQIKPGIVFETSRGCWWGEKNQCAFCGLSEPARDFRSKSPPRILAELATLRRTYGIAKFMASDTILDLKHFDTVLPELAAAPEPFTFFFETSPNLTRQQVEKMSAAGIRWVQPGIESLHDKTLALLNKGTRAWKNVQFLKWCMQFGVFASWNLLGNAPGESAEWHRETLAWLPLIAHLQPPMVLWLIRYDRYSRYHQDPARYHLALTPFRAYAAIYPMPAERLNDFAYYFEDAATQTAPVTPAQAAVFGELMQFIDAWQAQFYTPRPDMIKKDVSPTRPQLNLRDTGDRLILTDTRPCAVAPAIVLEGVARAVYLACDSALPAEMLVQALQNQFALTRTWDQLQPIVAQLLAQKILLHLDQRYLSLAVPEPLRPMPTFDNDPAGLVILPRKTKATL